MSGRSWYIVARRLVGGSPNVLITAIIGFLFGFIGSMPIAGPIAALIVTRCLELRFRAAMLIGIGSVIAETVYAFLAFLGFAILLSREPWIVPVSRGVGAAILLALGIAFVGGKTPSAIAPHVEERRGAGNLFLGFVVSALNPTLLVTWAGVSATLFSTGLVTFAPPLSVPFALGAGVGILSWYVILVRLIRRYRDRFRPEIVVRVIRFFGVVLIAMGLWFLWRLVQYLVAR